MATSGDANNKKKYDVFLNHRGPDVKKTIASCLYRWLTSRSPGLQVFLDSQELEEGQNLNTQIKEAIASASLHVAIFSPRYAESAWCLEELRLMFASGKPIIPIFDKVQPAVLRSAQEHRGAYAAALDKHENKIAGNGQPRHNSTTVGEWRNALSEAANISGFDLDAFNGDWGVLLFKVAECVFKRVEKSRILQISYEMRYRSGRILDTVNTIGMHDQPRALGRNHLNVISHSSNLLELNSLFCNYENQSRMTMPGLQKMVLIFSVKLTCNKRNMKLIPVELRFKERTMKPIATVEGVDSISVDFKEMKITVIGSADPLRLSLRVRKVGFSTELLSVSRAQMKFRRSEYKSMLRGRL